MTTTPPATPVDAVRAWWQAIQDGDLAALHRLTAPDYLASGGPAGRTTGREALLDEAAAFGSSARIDSWSLAAITVLDLGPVAACGSTGWSCRAVSPPTAGPPPTASRDGRRTTCTPSPASRWTPASRDLAANLDVWSARWAGKVLEYPTADLGLTGPGWPWGLAVRPLLLFAATLALLVGATRALTGRRAQAVGWRRLWTTWNRPATKSRSV